MHVRVLDLDGGLTAQDRLLNRAEPEVLPLRSRGPRLRLACSFGRFRRFEQDLMGLTGSDVEPDPCLTFVGSGDFHHVSLALLRRLATPCNLVIIDNHPDWMRGLPFLHCGTWVRHAARLPWVHRVFHVGGDVDFDNGFRWLAPWDDLRSGKITVLPALRRFRKGHWSDVPHKPLRSHREEPLTRDRIEECLEPFRSDLARWPLYVSLDKDVMTAKDAAVNWDSGHLTTSEVMELLQAFRTAAHGHLAGMDVVGDWSPVRVQGFFRRFLHYTEHPTLGTIPEEANRLNENLNLALLEIIRNVREQPVTVPLAV
jgi:hypothetical protein